MKKWMKAVSAILVLCMSLCLFGGMNVQADGEEIVYRMVVEYDGDDVLHDQKIDKDDFTVTIYYREDGTGSARRRKLDSSEFDISPDTMESKRSQRVTVRYEAVNSSFAASVYVDCAKPDLDYIVARYKGDDLIVGGEIDSDDVTVEAFYSDGTSEYVDGWSFRSYKLTEGSNTVTISYRENGITQYDDITVYAHDGDLSYISAYYSGGAVAVGGTVDTSKIKVTGVYSEKGSGNVTKTLNGWYLESYTIWEGNNTLTVVYKEDGVRYTDKITVRGTASGSTTTTAPSGNLDGNWVRSGSNWKYKINNNTYLINSWVQNPGSGDWYWLDANGNMAFNKWVQINSKWYWLDEDGTMATGWKMVNSKWYYLNEPSGDMYTGWIYYKDNWYYLTPGSGEMAKNVWVGNWYVNGDGVWSQTR